MNIARYERNQWFERLIALKAQHDPNRVIPADGWTPDTSILDLVTMSRQHTTAKPVVSMPPGRVGRPGIIRTRIRPDGLAEAVSLNNEDFQNESDEWYKGA